MSVSVFETYQSIRLPASNPCPLLIAAMLGMSTHTAPSVLYFSESS